MEIGFENGTINLDQAKGLYYTGQTVAGSVRFHLEQPVAVAALNIQFLGEARVLWTEQETQEQYGRSFETEVEYRAQEQYFNFVQCLYGGQGVSQLNAGPHEFPFQFQIPPNIPSSFEGDEGEVEYEIKAYLEYPGQGRETLEKVYTVICPIDLNKEDPEIAQPLGMEFEEVYSCGCACSPSPITVLVTLPVRGYCPGQAVPAAVDVTNRANVEVKKVVLQIVTRTRYHSREPTADFTTPEEVLVTVKTKPVLANTERHYTCDLTVPDMIAPNLKNCSIIDVGYFFKVTVTLSGCNDDLEDTSEIHIGQIPLHNFTNGQYVHPMAHSLPDGPIPDQISYTVPHVNTHTQAVPVNAYPSYQTQANPIGAYPAYQTQANPVGAYPGHQTQANPVGAYPGHQTQANPVGAYPGHQTQANPVNAYPGHQTQANPVSAYPVHPTQAIPLNAYPGHQTQAQPANPYPGYPSQPSAPVLSEGFLNPGVNNPNNRIGFRVDVPVSATPTVHKKPWMQAAIK